MERWKFPTTHALASYVVKHKHGRRDRYQIQAQLPLPGLASPGNGLSAMSWLC